MNIVFADETHRLQYEQRSVLEQCKSATILSHGYRIVCPLFLASVFDSRLLIKLQPLLDLSGSARNNSILTVPSSSSARITQKGG